MANVTVEDAGPCKKLLKIVVPAEEVAGKIEESYEKLRDSVTVDGFRKGRVPRKLLEKRFGEKVVEEVKETAMSDSSQKALEDNELTPIGEPSFDNVEYGDGGDLSFDVTVEVKPQFDLPDFAEIKLKRMSAEVTDEVLMEGLERIRMQRAKLEPVSEGGVAARDRVTADWKAVAGDDEVANEADAAIDVQGKKLGFVEVDLVASLEGAQAGETREMDVKFGQDCPQEQFRGQDGKVTMTIKQIQRPVAPELTDDFAKELDFDDIEELKDVVKSQLAARMERDVEADLRRQMAELLLQRVEIDLPEGLVKRQASDLLVRQQLRMRYEGVPEDEIEERLSEMQSSSEEVAERQFKEYFLYEKIAEGEKLFVTENEVDNRIGQLANSYRQSVQRMRKYLEEENALSQLRIQMREEKVMGLLLSKAEIQDAD